MRTKKLLTLILCFSVIFLFVGIMPIHGEEKIYSSVIRLHVIANSDSDADQALKLKVRDAVLAFTDELSSECQTLQEAESKISSSLDDIKAVSESVIEKEGSEYSVNVTLGIENYPSRSYASLCFPSGEYLSLRIMIGDAAGQNWWCVLFPPMCISAASYEEPVSLPTGFTGEEYKIITDTDGTKYKIRFKLLETIEKAIEK